jgi:hypothetical protein
MLRVQFKEAIEFIAHKVKQKALPMHPAQFFLDALVKRLATITQKSSLHTQEFFNLLNDLVCHHYHTKKTLPFVA